MKKQSQKKLEEELLRKRKHRESVRLKLKRKVWKRKRREDRTIDSIPETPISHMSGFLQGYL